MLAETLLGRLLEADFEYYTKGKSLWSDNEYDRMREEFKALDPSHPYHQTVGARIPADAKKVTHRLVAGSQEKIKTEDELMSWAEKNTQPGFVMQWKLDGSTLVLQYTDGCLVEAATRGDGIIGESVLWNVLLMPSVPKRLPIPFTGDVRGEVILSKAKHESIFKPLGYSNPRNSVAVIRDQKGTDLAQHLDFIAFDMVALDGEKCTTELACVATLTTLGFTPVYTLSIKSAQDLWSAFQKFEEKLPAFEYEADGVVARYDVVAAQAALGLSSDNRPKGQRSIKFANNEAETTVVGVEFTIGSTGRINPVIALNPVECGGVIISSVTGNNFQFIQENLGGICIGDKVVIERCGGVIPGIVRVIPRYSCPHCGFEGIENEQKIHHQGI